MLKIRTVCYMLCSYLRNSLTQRSQRVAFSFRGKCPLNTNDYITWPLILFKLRNKHRLKGITISYHSSTEHLHTSSLSSNTFLLYFPKQVPGYCFVSNALLSHLNKCSRENLTWILGGTMLHTIL